MARVGLPASKLKARKRRRRVRAFVYIFILLCALGAGAVALSWAPFVRIQDVAVDGVSSANPDTVTEEVRSYIEGKYWGILPRDNIFLYPKDEIHRQLLNEHPVFASVTITPAGFKALRVGAVERAPKALWCGEGPEVSSSCLLVDDGGAAYALAADFSALVYTRYAGPLPAGPMPRQFMTQEKFRALSAFVDEFARRLASTTVSAVVVEGNEARVECADGFTLIFSLSDNGADVLERFDLALTAVPFAGRPLAEFEYLDLRFGDKLYYKLKGAVESE